MIGKTDEQLVDDVLRHHHDSFEELVSRYEKQLYAFAIRFVQDASVAQDAVQDTFVKAWQRLRQFDAHYPFRVWLFAICRNTCLDFLKKKKEFPFSAFESDEGTNSVVDSLEDLETIPESALTRLDAQLLVEKILSGISPLYRDVILLRYVHGFSFDQISQILRRPLDTVKSQHRRALVHMRRLLERAPNDKR